MDNIYKYRKIFTDSQIADLKTLNRASENYLAFENYLMSPSAFIAYFSLYRNNWEVGKHKYLKFITSKNLLWLCYSNDYDPWSVAVKTKNTLFEYLQIEKIHAIYRCLYEVGGPISDFGLCIVQNTLDQFIDNMSYALSCNLRNVKECTQYLYERMHTELSLDRSYTAEAYTFIKFGMEYIDIAEELYALHLKLISNK